MTRSPQDITRNISPPQNPFVFPSPPFRCRYCFERASRRGGGEGVSSWQYVKLIRAAEWRGGCLSTEFAPGPAPAPACPANWPPEPALASTYETGDQVRARHRCRRRGPVLASCRMLCCSLDLNKNQRRLPESTTDPFFSGSVGTNISLRFLLFFFHRDVLKAVNMLRFKDISRGNEF